MDLLHLHCVTMLIFVNQQDTPEASGHVISSAVSENGWKKLITAHVTVIKSFLGQGL